MEQPPQIPPQGYYAQPRPVGGSGMAIAAMVLGIVSAVLFCAWYIAIPCGIVAIILGAIARKRVAAGMGGGGGMAVAGIVCGVIGVVLGVLVIAGVAAFLGWASTPAGQKKLQQLQQQQGQPGTVLPRSEPSILPERGGDVRTWLV